MDSFEIFHAFERSVIVYCGHNPEFCDFQMYADSIHRIGSRTTPTKVNRSCSLKKSQRASQKCSSNMNQLGRTWSSAIDLLPPHHVPALIWTQLRDWCREPHQLVNQKEGKRRPLQIVVSLEEEFFQIKKTKILFKKIRFILIQKKI